MNKVKELREYYGLSLQDLADKCDTGKASISDIEKERHEPKVYLAIRLAKALHTTVDDLFWEDTDGEK